MKRILNLLLLVFISQYAVSQGYRDEIDEANPAGSLMLRPVGPGMMTDNGPIPEDGGHIAKEMLVGPFVAGHSYLPYRTRLQIEKQVAILRDMIMKGATIDLVALYNNYTPNSFVIAKRRSGEVLKYLSVRGGISTRSFRVIYERADFKEDLDILYLRVNSPTPTYFTQPAAPTPSTLPVYTSPQYPVATPPVLPPGYVYDTTPQGQAETIYYQGPNGQVYSVPSSEAGQAAYQDSEGNVYELQAGAY